MAKIAITVDLETDWGGRYPLESSYCRGMQEGMDTFLNLVTPFQIKATCFVSAITVDRFAREIASLSSAGHEVASHGYQHNLDYRTLSPEQLLYQLERSKKVLEDCTGNRVIGFRTPQFVQNPALPDLLSRAGYCYDSSIAATTLPGRYSNQRSVAEPYLRGSILEIPVSRVPLLSLPFGLLWINLMGSSLYRFLRVIRNKELSLEVFYLHPFDLVEKQWNREMKVHVNLFYLFRSKSAVSTFQELLEIWVQRGFEFTRLCEIYGDYKRTTGIAP